MKYSKIKNFWYLRNLRFQRKAQIGEVIIFVAAVMVYFIFLLLFVFYFNSCSSEGKNTKIMSQDFEDIQAKTEITIFLRTPVEIYDMNTDITNMIVYNELLGNNDETKKLFAQIYHQTGLYPKSKVSSIDFNIDKTISRTQFYPGDRVCTEISTIITNKAYNKDRIIFTPCYK